LESELELARAVQQQLLPRDTKSLATIRFAAASVPAGEIGGDYYDFLDLGPHSLGFVVADVSGKGIAAALLVAHLQASFRGECARGVRDLRGVLERVNAQFFNSTLPEQFATIFFGQYDDFSRRLRYINCGHNPGLLIRTCGEVERLKATALPLGIVGQWDGEEEVVELSPGDTLCICSDGVVEAGMEYGEEFGERRLISLLHACKDKEIQAAVDLIMESVRAYQLNDETDDSTIVGIRSA
jgi:sigma-B regulation protein RsbU (phosphoserine phosphatase)